ncbi:symbiotic chitinase [Paraphoma chrysanthemicola]|uniref:chitinase n=1 Tax=Paraphoma chrysanthemicola TaxID=798071 RepID=A0A8K0QVP1_9PLEO|nr:symbiotic chitinase [Paraphoma chrysanthemicola]
MLNLHLSRGQTYTWLSALFLILVVSSVFFVDRDVPTAISKPVLSLRTDSSIPDLSNPEHLHKRHHQHHRHHHESPPTNHSALVRREDYSCGQGRPCANGACCGVSGFCGYGPTYCGTGCQSNCNAHAECGQYSEPANKKCPLNTCCSKHGFCGTTKDFCTDGCQSNCVLSPTPPSSKRGMALSKIIGYYESWSYRSTCNHKKPTDLPLSELTHLNYAFAFISPSSYELVVMDSKTDEALFKEVTATKDYNPDLKVFISVGGWTFSDNGTVTQPLLSEISSSEANRKKFSDNVVKFCNKWGFDGLDLDWEYPGAPDRGGKKEDTANFNLLMKALRQAFNGSPRALELSFTIPSSYWYLKWFDVPELLKYADWTNLMSYDLHGVWDRNNPIGSIVQSHTNLTEIKLAAELLWRVGVKPEQVALGYGFYGRAFELADPSCSTPGCAFKGGAKAGVCSGESGVLMHYEIQAILDQAPNLKPVWDKEAAAKYLVFDKNQWVSYDDKDTFGQKIDWAQSIGFGGALIWASDTDDDKFSAMSGFLDKKVDHIEVKSVALEANAVTIAQTHNALSGKGCSLYKEGGCYSQSDFDNLHVMCPNGNPPIGYDKAGCKNGGKPICCEGNVWPSKCTWRGSGGDCNGQCHPGEQKIHGSSWGGGYESESSVKKCSRGGKAFCCEAAGYKSLTNGCRWTNCGDSCNVGYKSMLTSKSCSFLRQKHYCCPTTTLLNTCSWRGSLPDCPVSNCEKDEVNVVLDEIGDRSLACAWGRSFAGCCKVSDPPPPALECDKTTCELDSSLCPNSEDEFGNPTVGTSTPSLAKRAGKAGYAWLTSTGLRMLARHRPHPTGAAYMRWLRQNLYNLSANWFRMQGRRCNQRNLEMVVIDQSADNYPAGGEIEHGVPRLITSRYPPVAASGQHWTPHPMDRRSNPRPRGAPTRTPALGNDAFWSNDWDGEFALPANVERLTPNSPLIRRPSDLFNEAFGSTTNPNNFVFLESGVNRAKGAIEGFNRRMADEVLRRRIRSAVAGNGTASRIILESFHETRAVFQYVNQEEVMTRTDNTVSLVRRALLIIERHIPSAVG